MKLTLAKLLAKTPWFYFEWGYFAHRDPQTGQPSKMWFVAPWGRYLTSQW